MSDILPVSSTRTAGRRDLRPVAAPARPDLEQDRPVRRGDDRVDVSDVARMISRMNEMPSIRTELVERVRNEIENGTYETEDKIDLAIDAMFDEIS